MSVLRTLLVLTLFSSLFFSTVSVAEDKKDDSAQRHDHVAAVRVVGIMEFQQGQDPFALVGPGVQFERAILHHLLEVELSASLLFGHGEIIPIDLLLKKPLHLTNSIDLYLGLGPSLTFIFPENSKSEIHPGVIGTLGTYMWFWGDVGVELELGYGVVFAEDLVHEVSAATGFLYRF